jgi:ABC-2 type transport system ATP-binding protein
VIRLQNLTKHYGRVTAVDSLNLEVQPGEIFGFLGPNGAGKTTTIRIMVGILKPTSGRVTLGGYDVERQPEQAKGITGFVPDRPFLYEKLSGSEFLNFVGRLHGIAAEKLQRRIPELLEQFELFEWKDELVEGYSQGMKQRLVLCASLIHRPRILIVDEPMVGIDPRGTRTLKDLFVTLAREGTTIFLSTHSISVAEEICQTVGIIHRGRLIASGTLEDLHRAAQVEAKGLESAFLELTRDGASPTGPEAEKP